MGIKIWGEVGKGKEGAAIMEDLKIDQAVYLALAYFPYFFCCNAVKIKVEYDLVLASVDEQGFYSRMNLKKTSVFGSIFS